MTAQIETTQKTTVTLSVEEFLEKLNLGVSGEVSSVFISQKIEGIDGFESVKVLPAQVIISFKEEVLKN